MSIWLIFFKVVNDLEESATKTDWLRRNTYNKINTSTEQYAKTGAGFFGGGIVGSTEKRDREIEEWC